jgi:hypothetical protein
LDASRVYGTRSDVRVSGLYRRGGDELKQPSFHRMKAMKTAALYAIKTPKMIACHVGMSATRVGPTS